jgi:acetyltransferase-like isoleucine patch superfamily enzyme
MGSDVRFYSPRASIFGSDPFLITLGSNVHITDGVRFITHDGGTLILRKHVPDLDYTAPIVVGDDVYIGVGSTILPGVRIGNRCVIGAGSVVSRDIPDNSVAVGIPARVIKTTDQYLEGLKRKSLHCGQLSGREKAAFLRKHFGV